MVPPSIQSQLAALRRRERGLRFVWGFARWFAIALGLLAVLCLCDWLMDRNTETPAAVRVLMFVVQLIVWIGGGYLLIIRPLERALSDSEMALWVEAKTPRLRHRLVSTVQLNRPGADTKGMSHDMIGAVTQEAEQMTGKMSFPQILDLKRLTRSALLVSPIVLLALTLFLIWPGIVSALVARQFLADVEIPRRVSIEAVYRQGGRYDPAPDQFYSPLREKVVLRFRVSGLEDDEDAEGEAFIEPIGSSGQRYTFPLERERKLADGAVIFSATVPDWAATGSFNYRASIVDGRTKRDRAVALEPRPEVADIAAEVELPEAFKLTPNRKRQKEGDIDGLPNSRAFVAIGIQKEKRLTHAELELLHQPMPLVLAYLRQDVGAAPATLLGAVAGRGGQLCAIRAAGDLPVTYRGDLGPELVHAHIPLKSADAKHVAAGDFKLEMGRSTGYRVLVRDQRDFENARPPRRDIKIAHAEPPTVRLLKERFVPRGLSLASKAAVVEGVPILEDMPMPVVYQCSDNFGLKNATLLFRILPREDASQSEVRDEDIPWVPLPLIEWLAGPDVGPFDLEVGAFQKSSSKDQIQFHAIPADAKSEWGRLLGGGRFDFQTRGIPGLKPGDRIEYCVQVRNINPDERRAVGRSETRKKKVVTTDEFIAWVQDVQKEQRRLQELEDRQRGVFSSSLGGPR